VIEYLDQNAEAIILIVVVVLTIISAIVFIGAIYSRWMLRLAESKSKKIRQQLSPLVIQYLSGDIEFDDLKKHLSTKTDYQILLKISNELDKDLEGEEEKKLKRLLNLKPIREFFTSRFESGDPLDAARACIYFAKKDKIRDSLIPKLVNNSSSEYPLLAYSAALAVITHGDANQKEEAIKNLLKNRELSNQALNDIFNEYQLRSSDNRKTEAELLMSLIKSKEYFPDRTALMIRTLGELNFYQSASFLLKEYLAHEEENYNPLIATALIDILSKFGMEEILKRLHLEFISSKYRDVRESVAKALGVFTKKESVPLLKWLLVDPDFYVRFFAARSLSYYPDIDLKDMQVYGMSESDWEELVGEIESSNIEGY